MLKIIYSKSLCAQSYFLSRDGEVTFREQFIKHMTIFFWLINYVQTFPVGCSSVLLSVQDGQTDGEEDIK